MWPERFACCMSAEDGLGCVSQLELLVAGFWLLGRRHAVSLPTGTIEAGHEFQSRELGFGVAFSRSQSPPEEKGNVSQKDVIVAGLTCLMLAGGQYQRGSLALDG